jgi:diguanylate cyclase (GGDEF)-like protein
VYDAASDDQPPCDQESSVSTDGPSSDPHASLPGAIEALATGGDLDATLAGVLAAAVTALRPTMGAIFVADPDRPGLQIVASHGLDEPARDHLVRETADPASPFSLAAVGRITAFDREATMPGGASFVGAYLPLVVTSGGVETSVGSLGLGWPGPHTLDGGEREMLLAVARLAAVAIDHARLASTVAERSEWFERMAHTDPLTGLANERTVGRILELEVARAARQGSEVSFAMFDVDDFRATNREGGHEAGDDVLRHVAAVLAESVRLVDTVGRIGGDEFVLVAPGSAGTLVAQRILDGIAALPAVAGRPITVSAGVARFPADGTDTAALIAAATDGLARARSEGRGTVVSGVAEGG